MRREKPLDNPEAVHAKTPISQYHRYKECSTLGAPLLTGILLMDFYFVGANTAFFSHTTTGVPISEGHTLW